MQEDEAPASSDFFDEFLSQVTFLKDKDEETCYKEIFRVLDEAKKGFITNETMRNLFDAVKSQVNISEEDINLLIDDIDKNKDGKVDFSEFYKFMLKE